MLGVNSHNRIEIYIEITNFSCMKSIIVIEYCLFVRRRHVGMADDADSKSVGRKPVWVQVPLPALFKEYCKITFTFKILVFTGFVEYQTKNKNLKSGIKISCFTPKCNTK